VHLIFRRLHSQQLWVPLRTFLRKVHSAPDGSLLAGSFVSFIATADGNMMCHWKGTLVDMRPEGESL
jgi:hypothetical protein